MRVRSALFAAVLVGVAALVFAGGSAIAAPPTNVHISGEVTLEHGFSLQLTANATGTSSLSGQGVDSTFHGHIPPASTCEFPLTGSVTENVVTLTGTVTQSSYKPFIGVPVMIVANASTGAITFTFGGVVLSGTGNVHIG